MTTPGEIKFIIADTSEDFDDARNLFQQYANSLETDLSFQDFSNELDTIDKQYNKPAGALVLAYANGMAVGCVGIRRFDQDRAELKRMFVLAEYRHLQIGQKLLELALDIARAYNYKFIRLDTLPTMTRAQKLYISFGFYEIPPYRFNPVSGTVYMEKKL